MRLRSYADAVQNERPSSDSASLEEVSLDAPGASSTPAASDGDDHSARVSADQLLAGVLLDVGLADKRVAKRWRQSVMDRKWDPAACTREVLGYATPEQRADPRVRERSARLLRDLLMAPLQRGVRGAARRGREKVRSGFAYLLVQAFVLLLFAAIAAGIGVLLRFKGNSLDAWADRVLDLFGLA